ncbi:MAG TPA: RluA family pseudouridine synthase, partial [Luteolibacter sp.]|nr:RluA family pseudouridine synthase [Luteolibacter sp.]
HVAEPEKLAQRVAERQARLDRVCSPLPGSIAQENRRPVHVRQQHDRMRLLDVLVDVFPQIPAAEWERRCDEGRFTSYAGVVRGKDHIVRAGERVLQLFDAEAEPAVATDIRILHEDDAIVVLHKPAPLPMHPSGRYHRNTLQHLLTLAYDAPRIPRLVHRLDANTSGLVVLGRTRHFARLLQRQFIEGQVEKTYLARVQGWPEEDSFRCELPISTEPGPAGSREIDEEEGQSALTLFRVLERCADGTALLEASLRTGRTHQIRIHLWQLGYPVVGDPMYLPGGLMGDRQTIDVEEVPMMLHAWKLGFKHPIQSERMSFEAEAEWK